LFLVQNSSEHIKQKLNCESEEVLRSPKITGCTITLSLCDKKHSVDPLKDFQCGSYRNDADFVIAAVRVLVGSTLRTIPRSIRVLGKAYETVEGEKRWYTFYLSVQEIAFAVRMGFVSITMDQCHDCISNPALDAIEIYALERQLIQKWLPITMHSLYSMVHDSHETSVESYKDSFRLCIQAWATLNIIVGNPKPNEVAAVFLQHLISETVLENDKRIHDSISCLFSSFETDEESRQCLVDHSILSGCTKFLSKLEESFKAVLNAADCQLENWMYLSLIPSLRLCLQTAANVARLRPFNYPQSVEGSIASNAFAVVDACLKCSVTFELVEDFVELLLLESTVANGTPLGRFGSFDGIRSLILSSNKQIASKTCESISRFCRYEDIFTAQTVAVKYVCDYCLRFINDIRYTIVEVEHGLDLCPECYRLAKDYAGKHNKKDEIKIDGRYVGEHRRLTCEEVAAMEPIPIQKPPAAVDSLSLNHQNRDQSSMAEIAHQNQLFNDFMDGLTTGIAGLLIDEFKKFGDIPSSFVRLSVDLIRHSIHSGRKVERGKELLASIAVGLNSRLRSASEECNAVECIRLVEGLICTFVQDEDVRKFVLSHEVFTSVSPPADSLVHACTVHKIPVGYFKPPGCTGSDRIFMACSKDPQHRCNFFKWVDKKGEISTEVTSGITEVTSGLFDEEIGKLVWQFFSSYSNEEMPMHLGLCYCVEKFSNLSSQQEASSTSNKTFLSDKFADIEGEFYDGVFCCHERLRSDFSVKDSIELFHKSQSSKPHIDVKTADSLLVEKLLELVSLVASPSTENLDPWYPVLCRLSASAKGPNASSSRVRTLARRCLWQLCGKDSIGSFAVRDHYLFTFQLEKLVRYTEDTLDFCITLNEKARLCGPHWKDSHRHSIKDLKVRHFIGSEALVSEDVSTLEANKVVKEMLHEIMTSAEKRGGNWRRFCGLHSFPVNLSKNTSDVHSEILAAPPIFILFAASCSTSIENQLLVLRIVRLALCRSGEHKGAPLQPVVIEEDDLDNPHPTSSFNKILYKNCTSPEKILDVSMDDVYAFVMSFVYRGTTYEIQKESLAIAKKLWLCLDASAQGTLFYRFFAVPLYNIGSMGKRCTCFLIFLQSMVSTSSCDAFDACRVMEVVQSCLQVQRLAACHDKSNGEYFHIGTKFGSTLKSKRYDLAVCRNCHAYVNRVKVRKAEKSSSAPSSSRATSTTTSSLINTGQWLRGQLSAFTRSSLDVGRESAVTSEFCCYVALKHRSFVSTIHIGIESPRRFVKTIKFAFTPRPVERISILKSEEYTNLWQPCGVLSVTRGCTRTSYTLPTPVIAANLKIEYADFYDKAVSTKSSDGTLIVHCPRCTRVVTNAHGVCASCGEVAFQCRKCRHINYERLDAFLCVECGYCASASFRYALITAVATNAVTITNDQDYNVALCRVKVASQLLEELRSTLKRKLRSLTENGSKTSRADDHLLCFLPLRQAFETVIPMRAIEDTAKDHDDVSSKTMLSQLGSSGSMIKIISNAVSYETVSSTVPDISLFQSTSVRSDRGSTSTRTVSTSSGSLLRDLARDALTIAGDDNNSDVSAVAVASELFSGLFDSSSGDSSFARYASRLDSNDPLRRLLASVQSRREGLEELIRNRSDSAATTSTTGGELTDVASKPSHRSSTTNITTTKPVIAKDDIELCDKLYHRMCEVECELYELNRRCDAWSRLNSGCLYSTSTDVSSHSLRFDASHCSSCAPLIVIHLLLLWLGIFLGDPKSIVVTPEMIVYLFDTDLTMMIQQQQRSSSSSSSSGTSTSSYQQLQETKRTIIQEIAIRSPQGTTLVLEALRLRLLTLLQDQNAADILGQILEAFAKINTSSMDKDSLINPVTPFVELAHEALKGKISL
jgi:hypothetical protein